MARPSDDYMARLYGEYSTKLAVYRTTRYAWEHGRTNSMIDSINAARVDVWRIAFSSNQPYKE